VTPADGRPVLPYQQQEDRTVNIPEDKRVAVLQALYADTFIAPAAIAFGTVGPDKLPTEAAEEALTYGYIDYLGGRLIKMDLTEDPVETRLFNRDNGEGAAERIIAAVLARD